MIRRILLASAGAMALTGAAHAADLTPPPPPPPPPPVWTGFYVGLNAGYEWNATRNVEFLTAPTFPGATLFAATANGLASSFSNGFIGGAQIGYNYQFNPTFVAGLEADFDGIASSNGEGSRTNVLAFPAAFLATTLDADKKVDYLGTVRGRVGFLATPTLLLYVDGGLAYGGVNLNDRALGFVAPFTFPVFAGFSNTSDTRVGWTVGGGFEWMFLPNWSAKVEYQYYDLGSVTLSGPFAFNLAPLTVGVTQERARFNGNVVRVGINYHFNWGAPPVVAKY